MAPPLNEPSSLRSWVWCVPKGRPRHASLAGFWQHPEKALAGLWKHRVSSQGHMSGLRALLSSASFPFVRKEKPHLLLRLPSSTAATFGKASHLGKEKVFWADHFAVQVKAGAGSWTWACTMLTLDSWEAFKFTDTLVSPPPSGEQQSRALGGGKWGGHSVFQILNNDLGHEDVTSLGTSLWTPRLNKYLPRPWFCQSGALRVRVVCRAPSWMSRTSEKPRRQQRRWRQRNSDLTWRWGEGWGTVECETARGSRVEKTR